MDHFCWSALIRNQLTETNQMFTQEVKRHINRLMFRVPASMSTKTHQLLTQKTLQSTAAAVIPQNHLGFFFSENYFFLTIRMKTGHILQSF